MSRQRGHLKKKNGPKAGMVVGRRPLLACSTTLGLRIGGHVGVQLGVDLAHKAIGCSLMMWYSSRTAMSHSGTNALRCRGHARRPAVLFLPISKVGLGLLLLSFLPVCSVTCSQLLLFLLSLAYFGGLLYRCYGCC